MRGTQFASTGHPDDERLLRGKEAAVVDMQVIPRIDDERLYQLMRWHGTDETNLPPASTLQNLSRDTIAALGQLQEARETIRQLRAAMGMAFWATEFRDVHAILLEALGPPPE
jgi:hypothetical protein